MKKAFFVIFTLLISFPTFADQCDELSEKINELDLRCDTNDTATTGICGAIASIAPVFTYKFFSLVCTMPTGTEYLCKHRGFLRNLLATCDVDTEVRVWTKEYGDQKAAENAAWKAQPLDGMRIVYESNLQVSKIKFDSKLERFTKNCALIGVDREVEGIKEFIQ